MLAVAAACWALVALLGIAVHGAHHAVPVDAHLTRVVSRVVPLHAAEWYQRWGDAPAFVLSVACVALFALLLGDAATVGLAVIGPPVAVLLNERLVKPLVAERIYPAPGFAFPSGHTAAIASVVTVVVVACARRWSWRGGGAVAAVPATAAAAAMALSVIRTGSHLASDALGGVALGAGTILTLACAEQVLFPRPS